MFDHFLRVSYTVRTPGGDFLDIVLNVKFFEFLDQELPRQFVSDSAVNVSAQGAQIYSGNSYVARNIWTINSPVTNEVAEGILEAYRRFEANRSEGGLPYVDIEDKTFGSTVIATAVFSAPPSVSKFGNSPTHVIITFGLTQV